jgi:hypothetical protein
MQAAGVSLSPHWVFGYGSLLADYGAGLDRAPSAAGFLCTVDGWGRVWNIATDNERRRVWERADGSRPSLYVTLINIEPCEGSAVNGLLYPVKGALSDTDLREANYVRRELSVRPDGLPAEARAWIYVGSDAARLRFERGCSEGRACVSRWYRERVGDGFRRAGADEWELFCRSTVGPTVPDEEIWRWRDRATQNHVEADDPQR